MDWMRTIQIIPHSISQQLQVGGYHGLSSLDGHLAGVVILLVAAFARFVLTDAPIALGGFDAGA